MLVASHTEVTWWPIARSTVQGLSGAPVRLITVAVAWNPAFQLLSTFHATSTPVVGVVAAIVAGATKPKAAIADTVMTPAIDDLRIRASCLALI